MVILTDLSSENDAAKPNADAAQVANPPASRDGALTVLGIETSCDETAASVVRLAADGETQVLSSIIHSQIDDHQAYGGVVPEIAARSHVEMIEGVAARAMAQAGLGYGDLDGVGATAGPGLVGGVMVGLGFGKAVALARGLPFVAVNHLEGHAVSARLGARVDYPFLLLLVSGGHCQLLEVRGIGDMSRLGTTIDDAAGEAFDKSAKLLGLGYPGGPALARLAEQGRADAVALPRPLLHSRDLDFSFAGLKTAVMLRAREATTAAQRADLAASAQAAIVDVLCAKALRALADSGASRLVVAGGVGANRQLRERLDAGARRLGARVHYPPLSLCTDNGAMIAMAAALRLRAGRARVRLDGAFDVRPRWPLDRIDDDTDVSWVSPSWPRA